MRFPTKPAVDATAAGGRGCHLWPRMSVCFPEPLLCLAFYVLAYNIWRKVLAMFVQDWIYDFWTPGIDIRVVMGEAVLKARSIEADGWPWQKWLKLLTESPDAHAIWYV